MVADPIQCLGGSCSAEVLRPVAGSGQVRSALAPVIKGGSRWLLLFIQKISLLRKIIVNTSLLCIKVLLIV